MLVIPGDAEKFELERIRAESAWLGEFEVEASLYGKAAEIFHAAFADSTWAGYSRNWRFWTQFATERGWPYLPSVPAAVAFYVVSLGGVYKYATIVQKVIAI